MLNRDALERCVGHNHAVQANHPKQAAMELVGAALVVTVKKHDFGSDFVLCPSLQVFRPRKADKMLLKTSPRFGANTLLFRTNR